MTQLEIERKWLLRKLPVFEFDDTIHIIQHYLNDAAGKRFRLRRSEYVEGSETVKYHINRKNELRKGVFEEYEEELDLAAYSNHLNSNKQLKLIEKIRYVKTINGMKYEFDVYEDIALVTLEIEFPTENTDIVLDKTVQELVIKDVTGIQEFSNYALAYNVD